MAEKVKAKAAVEENKPADNKDVLASDDNASIDYSSLSKASSEDEYKGVDVNSKFKLTIARWIIALKNHVSTIPFIMTIATMVMLTWCLHTHNDAVRSLQSSIEPFLVFVDTLLSMLSCLAYLNVQGKHTEKKKVIAMSVLFYVLMIGQLLIDYHIVHQINVEMGLINGGITGDAKIALVNMSLGYFRAHIIMIYVTIALAIAAPIAQPFTKKIRVRF